MANATCQESMTGSTPGTAAAATAASAMSAQAGRDTRSCRASPRIHQPGLSWPTTESSPSGMIDWFTLHNLTRSGARFMGRSYPGFGMAPRIGRTAPAGRSPHFRWHAP